MPSDAAEQHQELVRDVRTEKQSRLTRENFDERTRRVRC